MNRSKETSKHELWVSCPACGKKNLKSQTGIHPVKCDACKHDYMAMVIKDGIIIMPNMEEDLYSSFKRYEGYIKELIRLAEV